MVKIQTHFFEGDIKRSLLGTTSGYQGMEKPIIENDWSRTAWELLKFNAPEPWNHWQRSSWVWVASRGPPLSTLFWLSKVTGLILPPRESLCCSPSIPLMTGQPLDKTFSVNVKPPHEKPWTAVHWGGQDTPPTSTYPTVANMGNCRACTSLLR